MIDIKKTYSSSNCGPFKVVAYHSAYDIDIQFINTGYSAKAKSSTITSGKIKDPLHPNICGVGYIGVGDNKTSINGNLTPAYICWYSMIYRCYDYKSLKKRPTYESVTVCEEWLSFQVFAEWHKSNCILGFVIDKDVKQKGVENKIYSPKTCCFISGAENSAAASAKVFYFVDPDGNEVEAYNLSGFCRDNGLNRSCMSAVSAGEIKQYMGWSKSTKKPLTVDKS